MNKKGYTLIEIIVVITLLAIIGTGTIIGGIRINKINKEKEREKLIDKIKVSADVYSTNTKYLSQLENNSYVYVPITELIDSGYLDEVINPLTKEEIYKERDYDKVLIKKDYMGIITIQYPLHDVEELIELDPLIIYKDETFDCNLGLDDSKYNSIKNSIGYTCIKDGIDFNNITGTKKIKYKYTDKDNIYRTTLRTLEIDEIPIPTITLTGTKGNNKWYRSYVSLSYSNLCTRRSSVSDICYRATSDGTKLLNNVINSSQSIQLKNCINGTTNCGNLSSMQNIQIDKDKPTIIGPSNNTTYNKSVTIYPSIADSISGIDDTKSYYCWNDKNDANCNVSNKTYFSSNATVTKSNGTGTFYLNVYAEDKAGNSIRNRTSYKLDNTKPSIEINSNSNYFLTNLKVTLSDSHSGINSNNSYYCWKTSQNGTCYTTSTKITTSNQNISGGTSTYPWLYILAKDNAGNEYSITKNYIFDTTAPVINITPGANSTYVQRQNITINITENNLDTNNTYYCFKTSQNGVCTKNYITSNTTSITTPLNYGGYVWLYVYAKDKFGYSSNKEVKYLIDSKPPIIDKLDFDLNTRKISVEFKDNESGIRYYSLKENNNVISEQNLSQSYYNNNFTITKGGTYKLTVRDGVGNETTKNLDISNFFYAEIKGFECRAYYTDYKGRLDYDSENNLEDCLYLTYMSGELITTLHSNEELESIYCIECNKSSNCTNVSGVTHTTATTSNYTRNGDHYVYSCTLDRKYRTWGWSDYTLELRLKRKNGTEQIIRNSTSAHEYFITTW